MAFKIWGLGSLVKSDIYDGTTEYNHIEAVEGGDVNNHLSLQRTLRNMYRNEEEAYNFLVDSMLTTSSREGIFKTSNAFVFDPTDAVAVNVPDTNEITEVTTIADTAGSLGGTYFNIYSTTTTFYVWFNVDGGSVEPTTTGTGIEVDIASGDDANTVADKLSFAIDQNLSFYSSVSTNIVTVVNVVGGSVTNAADVDTGFTITTTQEGVDNYKYYLRLSPGAGYFSGNIVVNKPQTYIAERQLEDVLGLVNWTAVPEEVNISFDGVYNAEIKKRNSNGTLITHSFNNNYNTFVGLLGDIYNDVYFHDALYNSIGTNLERIICEPTFEVVTDLYSVGVDTNGDFYVNSTAGDNDFYEIDIVVSAGTVTASLTNDDRIYFQNYNDFLGDVILNVPSNLTDSTDDLTSIDYSKVINGDTEFVFLHETSSAEDNKIFKWNDAEGRFEFNDTVHITGDIIVTGAENIVDTLNVNDNFIIVNDNQTGTPATSLTSGIEVNRGDSTNYRFMFRENDDTFVIGESGSEQAVATREDDDVINTKGIPYWNSTDFKFDTVSNFVYDTVNGRVGINNATPSYSLDITGTLNATGNTTIGGTLTSSNALTVSSGGADITGTLTSSDALTISSGGFNVTGNSDVDGTLTTTGNIDAPSLSVNAGNITVGTITLSDNEWTQLNNIGTVTISGTQWGYLGALNQNVHSTSNPSFSSINGLDISTGTNTFTLTRGTSTFTRSGAHALTLTTTASTNVTLPTSGTLATTANINNNTLTLATSGIATGDATWTANQGSNATFTVNVPGTNLGITADSTSGPTITSSTGSNTTLPTATASASGVVVTGAQTFGGWKTFSTGVIIGSTSSTTNGAIWIA